MVVVVVVVVLVALGVVVVDGRRGVLGYWWWHICGCSGGDRLCKVGKSKSSNWWCQWWCSVEKLPVFKRARPF